MSNGPGAWYVGRYKVRDPRLGSSLPDTTDANKMIQYAILSFKKELQYNGFGKDMGPGTVYGDNMAAAVEQFQKSHGATVDKPGEIGPHTARILYRKRCKEAEAKYSVPDKLIRKQWSLESFYDPAAIGVVDDFDHGLNQVHLPFHPEVSEQDSADGEFMAEWTGKWFSDTAKNFNNDYDGVLASYNIGTTYAHQWVDAGKPTTGGPNDTLPTLWNTAYHYVVLVRNQRLTQ